MPRNAISATAATAVLPAASSERENGSCSLLRFMRRSVLEFMRRLFGCSTLNASGSAGRTLRRGAFAWGGPAVRAELAMCAHGHQTLRARHMSRRSQVARSLHGESVACLIALDQP